MMELLNKNHIKNKLIAKYLENKCLKWLQKTINLYNNLKPKHI